MTNLVHFHYFLTLEFQQTKEGIFCLSISMFVTFFITFTWNFLNQRHLPSSIDSKKNPLALHPKQMPLVSPACWQSLRYLTHTHNDISFVVGLVYQYMKMPHESHWKETNKILCYIQGTIQFWIHQSLGGTPLMVFFTDLMG